MPLKAMLLVATAALLTAGAAQANGFRHNSFERFVVGGFNDDDTTYLKDLGTVEDVAEDAEDAVSDAAEAARDLVDEVMDND